MIQVIFKNSKLNVILSENEKTNKLYADHLKQQIIDIDNKIDLHQHIVISNVIQDNFIQSVQSLTQSKKNLEYQLNRINNMIKINDDSTMKYTRILVIIETKHKVTKKDVETKMSQIKEIQSFINNAKEYYDITFPLKQIDKEFRKYSRQQKELRRKSARGENTSSEMKQINNASKKLYTNKPFVFSSIQNKINEKEWTERFMKFCDYENFAFDQVVLFMGGPLWESEDLQKVLINNKHHVIVQGSTNFIIKN